MGSSNSHPSLFLVFILFRKEKEVNECIICKGPIDEHKTPDGKVFWTKGHNARPVAEGQCCTLCNNSTVIPTRIQGTNWVLGTGSTDA